MGATSTQRPQLYEWRGEFMNCPYEDDDGWRPQGVSAKAELFSNPAVPPIQNKSCRHTRQVSDAVLGRMLKSPRELENRSVRVRTRESSALEKLATHTTRGREPRTNRDG